MGVDGNRRDGNRPRGILRCGNRVQSSLRIPVDYRRDIDRDLHFPDSGLAALWLPSLGNSDHFDGQRDSSELSPGDHS